MDQDDKAARDVRRPNGGRVVPIVRTTAPAGTPARRSPEGPMAKGEALPAPSASGPRMPSDRPGPAVDTLTPPRTVGGHTARLKVEHEVDLDFGPKPQAALAMAEPPKPPQAPQAEPFEPVPSARTVGGHTARLLVDEPTADEGGRPVPIAAGELPRSPAQLLEAAAKRAQAKAAEEMASRQLDAAQEQMRAQQRAAARAATAEHEAKVMASHEAAVKDAEARLAAAKEAQKHAEKVRRASALPSDEEPGFFALLFAPMSVSVGLPFFAMGVMIALAIDGRFTGGVRPSTPAPPPTVTVTVTGAPPPPTRVTALPVTTQVPTPTAMAPLTTTTPPRPTSVPGPGTKPHVPRTGPTSTLPTGPVF